MAGSPPQQAQLALTAGRSCRLTARAYQVGRAALREIATIARPDTLLRWPGPPSGITREFDNRLISGPPAIEMNQSCAAPPSLGGGLNFHQPAA
jgi:hypothetical protein